jgi:hypothetical protein
VANVTTGLTTQLQAYVNTSLQDIIIAKNTITNIYNDVTGNVLGFLNITSTCIDTFSSFVQSSIQSVTGGIKTAINDKLQALITTLTPTATSSGQINRKQDIPANAVLQGDFLSGLISSATAGISSVINKIITPATGDINSFIDNTMGQVTSIVTQITTQVNGITALLDPTNASNFISAAITRVVGQIDSYDELTDDKIDEISTYATNLVEQKANQLIGFATNFINNLFAQVSALSVSSQTVLQHMTNTLKTTAQEQINGTIALVESQIETAITTLNSSAGMTIDNMKQQLINTISSEITTKINSITFTFNVSADFGLSEYFTHLTGDITSFMAMAVTKASSVKDQIVSKVTEAQDDVEDMLDIAFEDISNITDITAALIPELARNITV